MAVNYKLIRSVIKDYFKIDKNPKKGLMTLEWVMLGYMTITIITMLFTYTKLVNPEAMLWGRLRVLVMPIALWAVYRGNADMHLKNFSLYNNRKLAQRVQQG